MFITDFQRVAVPLIGAVALAAACFTGAVVPANASAATIHADGTMRTAPITTGLVGAVRY